MTARSFARLATAAAILTVALVSRPAAAATQPRMFLTWNAPWGTPRAADLLNVVCRDTGRVDTLYLCFDPGQDSLEITSIAAQLRIWPTPPDTLARAWWFESHSNPAQIRAQFNPPDLPGVEAIWEASGAGGIRTVTKGEGARVRLIWAVRTMDRAVIRGGTVYGFARVLVPRPASRALCRSPLCIEWEFAELTDARRKVSVLQKGPRFVSWNPGGKDPCAAHRRAGRVTPWVGTSGDR